MDAYIELCFKTGTNDELIQAALYDFDAQGVVEEDDAWKIYYPQRIWNEREMEIRITVEKTAPGSLFKVRAIDQQNWNDKWEKSIQPVQVSEHITIAPSWSNYAPANGELVLTIDPKMSFGTGFHETTRIMLRLMERWIRPNDRALDAGTGTGVLAIAAVKLGASSAVGVDTDEWIEENAAENIERNDAKEHVEVFIGSVERAEGMFDIILSNITRNDNIDLLDQFMEKLNPGGRLLLSGLYATDADSMTEACQARGFEKTDEEAENEWIGLVYQPKP